MDLFAVQVSEKMGNVKYDEPRVAINRVYTRTGDKGETGLAGGQRVAKDSLRIEAYGTVDELNATIGVARATAEEAIASHTKLAELDTILKRVQHELFNVGSILATLPEDVHPRQARITQTEITRLETEIDRMNAGLPALRSFVLPGRLPFERGAARLSHRLPARRTSLCSAGSRGTRGCGDDPVPEPAERRPVCVEPLGESYTGCIGDFVGTKPRCFGAARK